jgi:hypothetical protein
VTSGGDAAAWPVLPEATVEEQTTLDEAALAGVEASCFADAQAAANGQGYDTFVAAGTVAAGAVEVTWAAYGKGTETRVATAHCKGADCTCAVGHATAEGASFEAVGGGEVEVAAVGAPVLAKSLSDASDLGSPTNLATMESALLDSVPAKPEGAAGKKRFVVANAFGDVFGATFEGLTAAAKATSAYTEVREEQYVTAATIDGLLRDLHGQDVLVWFGATVRADKGSSGQKPEGMTVNVGLYGDETYDRERMDAALATAPLGGPGLLVLAGAESFGNAEKGLDGFASLKHLVKSAGARNRAVVGFRGMVGAEDAMVALGAMFDAWFAGQSLTDALAAGNAELTTRGSSATLVTNLDADRAGAYTLLPAPSAYWGDDAPGSGQFVGYLLVSGASTCDGSNPVEQTVQFFTDVAFDGPFFHGAKDADGVEIEVFGLLEHRMPGARFEVWMQGSPNEEMNGITVLGDAQFCKAGQCAGDVAAESAFVPGGGNMYFAGQGDATEYTNAKGETCRLSQPPLTQKGGKPGWLKLDL